MKMRSPLLAMFAAMALAARRHAPNGTSKYMPHMGAKQRAKGLARESERKCRTCRYWNAHSIDMRLGDCMAPNDHRYWRGRFGPNDRSEFLLDSFGREETKPGYSCDAWRGGDEGEVAA